MESSASARRTCAPAAEPRRELLGLVLGFLGVFVFSLTLPMTRLAVLELPPSFVAFGRIALAGLAGAALLAVTAARRPSRAEWRDLVVVSGGVVFGFPFLTTLALREVSASHGAVVLAVLPLMTAAAGAWLAGERPSRTFWAYAVAGSLCVLVFVLGRAEGRLAFADLYLALACLAAAFGYAVGGRLARTMPGLVVIAWALVLAMPVSVPGALLAADGVAEGAASAAAWLGFAYVTLGSQFVGFLFWYRGLAMGGIARVSQVQLLQTFLTLGFAALLLGERLDAVTLGFALATVAIVALGRRARVARAG